LVTGGSMMILKSLRILRPAAPDLQQLARGLAETQDAPLRSVLQMDLGSANAFAATWTHELILTDAAVTALDRSELASVISHEMGHLKESRLTCWKRMVALPGIVAIGLAPAAIVDGKPLVAIGLFAGFFIVIRLASRNHKRLEVAADLHAHHPRFGKNPRRQPDSRGFQRPASLSPSLRPDDQRRRATGFSAPGCARPGGFIRARRGRSGLLFLPLGLVRRNRRRLAGSTLAEKRVFRGSLEIRRKRALFAPWQDAAEGNHSGNQRGDTERSQRNHGEIVLDKLRASLAAERRGLRRIGLSDTSNSARHGSSDNAETEVQRREK
jgi:hypothetical protein